MLSLGHRKRAWSIDSEDSDLDKQPLKRSKGNTVNIEGNEDILETSDDEDDMQEHNDITKSRKDQERIMVDEDSDDESGTSRGCGTEESDFDDFPIKKSPVPSRSASSSRSRSPTFEGLRASFRETPESDADSSNQLDEDDKDDHEKPMHGSGDGRPTFFANMMDETDDEEREDLPGLTLSQKTIGTDVGTSQTAPLSVFDALMAFCNFKEPVAPDSPVFEDEFDWSNRLPVQERKRIFLQTYWRHKLPYLKRCVQAYYSYLPANRDADSCWLYTGPRLPKPPHHNLGVNISFMHNNKSEQVALHIVFISKLLQGLLSEEELVGIANESWHASHLCGNWTCLNERHVHPEPGKVNINRNPCFRNVSGPCAHIPVCLKHLKLAGDILRPLPTPTAETSQSYNYPIS